MRPGQRSALTASFTLLLAAAITVAAISAAGAPVAVAAAPAAVAAAPAAVAAAPAAVDGGVLFTFSKPSARSVHLAGMFNGWDPSALPMSDEDGDGIWEVVLELPTERTFEYKFVVNDGELWEYDPNNPERVDDNHGSYNTVISIAADGSVVLGHLDGPQSFDPVVGDLESYGRTLNVAIVWHQHQPKYLKDLSTGEYAEPWVRMHAIKDYYDMVAILDDYPDIHFTVNLTPILLMQLEELLAAWDEGRPTDAYLRMTLKDASELTEDDQVFLLTHFFNANWDNMIHIWPRYKELKDKKGGDSYEELTAAALTFSEQDWCDLQMWFNLAWFDPDFQEGDVELVDGRIVTVRHLIEKERHFTAAEKREVLAVERAIMENVVEVHRLAQERGQIEIITTPFYHPILPLIYDTDLAHVAMPGAALPARRFSHPEDALAHVELAADYYEKLFGRRPDGLWPGEGSVSQEIISTVEAGGFSWMASDDQLLQKSLGGSPLSARQKYQMYWAVDDDARVAMIFRDHGLSDEIGFNFSKMDGVAAANSMMRSLHGIHKALAGDDRDYIVPIILDGENAWDWYRHDGKEFFHSWYEQMSEAGWLRTVTVAEYLEEHPPTATIQQLWAGSWISSDFSTWIGEDEENKAWDYLTTVRDYLAGKDESGTVDADLLARAYDEIYAAEGSDWFWWYGTDQDSANDGAFDEIFRGTLKNVYEILGDEPPVFLSQAISAAGKGGGGGVMARAATAGDAELLLGPVLLDEGILFSTKHMSADRVNVAGEFNGWSTDATPMSDEDGDGIWIVIMELEPGSYEYKFVTDGGASWIADEGNPESVPDPYGGKNSLVIVE